MRSSTRSASRRAYPLASRSRSSRNLHLAIVGPTASGKSALAMAVAEAIGDVEIVSLDSMQVYRGMDIGTAKATIAERALVPHHLIDVADPSDDWSVKRTQVMAREAMLAIEQRGRRALLVGGTGLYVQAVIDDLMLPSEDLALRAELEASTSTPAGLDAAWRELLARDPVAASRIDEHNQRRVVRALEVIRSTGQPFSSFGRGVFARRDSPGAFPVALVGLWLTRDESRQRIEARCRSMREQGLVAEVARLAPHLARTAAQAIGYKEVLAHLAGDATADEAFERIARRTRSFARRQRMWFRRDPRITWISATGRNVAGLCDVVVASWRRPSARAGPTASHAT